MLVVGLHGWILPPFLILICDLFVYAEFMIHPVILLTTSGELRREITASISSKYTVRVAQNSNIQPGQILFPGFETRSKVSVLLFVLQFPRGGRGR